MKSVVVIVTILALLGPSQIIYAVAQGGAGAGGSGGSNAGQDQRDKDQIREQDRGRVQDPTTHDGDEPAQDQDRDQIRIKPEVVPAPATDSFQLRQMMQERERELNQEASSTPAPQQNIIRHENRARLMIHAMLSSEDLLGGNIGPRVAEIAQEINGSIQATVRAEAAIANRNLWTRIFMGGDSKSAQAILQEVERNRIRIEELNRLLEQAGISAEVKNMLQEQIRAMEQEQERLHTLANREEKSWGLFSWRF